MRDGTSLTFEKLTGRLQTLGKIKTVTPAQADIVSIGSDALVAKDAYFRTGDESIVTNFVDKHDINPKELHGAHIEMHLDDAPDVTLSKEEKHAVAAAMDAVKFLDFKTESIVVIYLHHSVFENKAFTSHLHRNSRWLLQPKIRAFRPKRQNALIFK